MAFELSPKGTLRLQIVLAAAAIAALALVLAIAIVLNGLPYWRGWWFVMAGLLVAAIPASIIASRLVEWVIAGYRAE